MDSTGWVAADHGASTSAFLTLGAAVTGWVVGRGHKIWITKDAILIPSCLKNVHDDLEAIKKILEELDDDDKARLEELRGESDMTFSQLRRKYKRYLSDYNVKVVEFNELGWAATWNPFNAAFLKAKKEAELITTEVQALRKDAVSSTSALLQADMLQRESEREAEELEAQRERERGFEAEHTDLPLLPLPVTATSTPFRAPLQVYFVARARNPLPAILARQMLNAAA